MNTDERKGPYAYRVSAERYELWSEAFKASQALREADTFSSLSQAGQAAFARWIAALDALSGETPAEQKNYRPADYDDHGDGTRRMTAACPACYKPWKAHHEASDALLAVALEIAMDSRCDLVDSERRIRLYSAITNAGGTV